MTRAQDRLLLFHAHNRRRFGDFEPMMQSRFIVEIPSELLATYEPARETRRRARWASAQPSWRSYSEGDPDAFWSGQGLASETETEPEPMTYEDDYPQEPVQLVRGMRVRHAKFGEGIVDGIEGKGEMMKVKVVFGRHTTKKFVARYARLIPVL